MKSKPVFQHDDLEHAPPTKKHKKQRKEKKHEKNKKSKLSILPNQATSIETPSSSKKVSIIIL